MHYPSLGLFTLLLTLVSAKSADIEFVQACDSSSDDVTNQCINRIPENIGIGTGNHACAYHEAEVRCLGLCGNTVTWKVAYTNALKRYRLVCASYIDERMAEKEEMGEANGDRGPQKQKQKPREEQSEAKEEVVEKAKKTSDAKATKSVDKNKSGATQSKDAKPTAQAKPTTIKVSIKTASDTDKSAHTKSDISAHNTNSKDTNKARAMIPTMDPELADSSSTSSLALSAILLSIAATLF
ncbi:hypothetical protein GGH12_004487 [Coemansia sp. RSA 1822]|nr:hypothetical protein LPJ76_004452 [Coemansia sp. RSA 638]KAJ2124132.1 hypothetical protein IW147_002068 [Coemansia sp. RSA 720]KAJ2540694.1 hypothetical protein GGF49_004264 [Coemansia sp. RSA 1853]KAJ2560838.1 hypothetical protein GGH12_004487 [Coemansia sp. RSA 1822]KAJ2664575.1 hypothetical protein IW148_001895 [Coemansia sp. RSA 1199]